jgi:hypothetical protein
MRIKSKGDKVIKYDEGKRIVVIEKKKGRKR